MAERLTSKREIVMTDIVRHRLFNQQLSCKKFSSPEEIVERLGAIQAQDYPGGLWGIGLRLGNATIADVETAVANRKIIRTWPMRGTLHFVPAKDAKWMLELLTPRVIKKSSGRYKELGLTEDIFERSKGLLVKALQGNKQLTRSEMYQALEKGGVRSDGQRAYHILGHLAQKGLICFGTRREKQHTFALLDEWATGSKELSRNKALAEIARRYFTGHGPATLKDFMWWAGLTAADARAGAESAKGITSEEINGQAYFLPRKIASGWDFPNAHLLPPYDEYFIAYKDRSAAIGKNIMGKINPALTSSPIIINGQATGIWQRFVKRDEVVVTTRLFRKLDKTEKEALAEAANRYGKFLGKPAICSKVYIRNKL
ncbi:MAG TPA: winged helix DNA-binding domain-containing protein [Candidatus Nanoarchaeia archaeon]|nr:winged helix DNA-binding domain-containing protein [Candidatus Nanoarchaeia archaeon]